MFLFLCYVSCIHLPLPRHQSYALMSCCFFPQAAFLARLVGSDVAVASAHSSLKSMSGNSPGTELAARNCFLLEDQLDDKKEATTSERYVMLCGKFAFRYFHNHSNGCSLEFTLLCLNVS